MSDWTAGYVADIEYTYGYYTELNPLRLRLAFLHAGLICPEAGVACELGFGQGLSINLHAAATVTQWYGTDFNPSQTDFAQELATVSGSGAKLYDQAFADFAARPDLPEFDYIGIHGIWSWISDENRAVIVDFIRRKLKVGGVLYISYNTMPGWATFAPVRHLLVEYANLPGTARGNSLGGIDRSIEFMEQLIATNPLFCKAHESIIDRIKKLKGQSRRYLAHEYFNRDWAPTYFADMADWLSAAKVSYACSARYLEHIDVLNITLEQQTFLNEIPDPVLRQSVRDFMVNQQFRQDYWVKGPRRIASGEQIEALRNQKMVLVSPRSEVSSKVAGALGVGSMNDAIYPLLLDLLADNRPRTIGEIEQNLKTGTVTFGQLLQAIMVLIGAGDAGLAQDDTVAQGVRYKTDRLNAHLMKKAYYGNDIEYLRVLKDTHLFIAIIIDCIWNFSLLLSIP